MANPAACIPSTSCIIADLVGIINTLERSHEDITYRSVLLPAPALRSTDYQFRALSRWFRKHTFSINPQEGPARFPFCYCPALEKPCCGSTTSRFRNKVLVRRRVWRGEPMLHLLLQLVAYKIPSVTGLTATRCGKGNNKRCVLCILFNVW